MWSFVKLLGGGVYKLIEGWFDLKKAKQEGEIAYQRRAQEGEQNWDLEAMKAARYSWKDELITIIWYSPLIIGWFDRIEYKNPEGVLETSWHLREADEWINFVSELPYWWQFGAFGIMAASFGLRWYFKRQNFEVGKKDG